MFKQGKATGLISRTALVTLILTLSLISSPSYAQETVADQLDAALSAYNDLEFDAGIEAAKAVLKRDDVAAKDSVVAYEILSMLTYAKGESFFREAIGYLNKINDLGPCVVHLPRELWPAELRTKWFEILNEHNKLNCPRDSKPGVPTVAIMEFDNFSIGEYQEKLAFIGKAMADWFRRDFGKISSLRVVEREKVDVVLKELELQKSGVVDEATAVEAGKLLGVQYMVFGSVTQLDGKNARMIVRTVSVETSEIVASVDREGKPEFSKMEKELVAELAKALEVPVPEDEKALLEEGGTDNYDATTLYSKGLEYMDRYEYRKAYEFFKKAYDLDNTFADAKRKMEIYQPLVG